jgi:galactokinase
VCSVDPTQCQLLIIDTCAAHALIDGVHAERRSSCLKAAAILDVTALCDTTGADLTAARDRLGELRYRHARHVVTKTPPPPRCRRGPPSRPPIWSAHC